MQTLTGTIKRIISTRDRREHPDEGGYSGTHGWVYTFDVTIQNPQGTLTGEIGSKTEQYPLVEGQEITVEPRRTEHGVKFKKINPQYSGGSSHRGKKDDVDWDKIAEGKVLCNMISAAITAGQIKCPDIRTAKYLTDVIMGKTTDPQGGDPNPDYEENPQEPTDDIPF